jgi:hypothetical protein
MSLAASPHEADVSFDIRLYFREDESGYRWAEVAFLDRGHQQPIMDHMPLVGRPGVPWFFDEIVDRGFD